MIQVLTRDLDTQVGRASLRFGDLGAVQARFWIRYLGKAGIGAPYS